VFTVGTLNHELTLLLLPIYALAQFDHVPRKRLIGDLLAQAVLYALVRVMYFHLVPVPAAYESGKFWWNVQWMIHRHGSVVTWLGTMLPWAVAAWLGWKSAPVALRRCAILFPLLFATTFLFGQFNEPRQFDAFSPVAIALILCFVAERMRFGSVEATHVFWDTPPRSRREE